MSCGHVGCCDSSPYKHATGHWHETQHPIMRSLEPGETWGWCFPEEVQLYARTGAAPSAPRRGRIATGTGH